MIATNTVAQGDTRTSGLEEAIRQGRKIYQAQRRYQWPGNATVVASLLQIQKTRKVAYPVLDGVSVDRISAYLLAGQVDSTPIALSGNKGICYRGTKIWGSGFVFEDPPSNGSSSLVEMERLISEDPRNREVIFSYLGGDDFNSSPIQHPSRFVIDFGTMSADQARCWPILFRIVEERVRPVREKNKQRNYRENWWLHANRVDDAGPYLELHGRLLALTCVSQHLALAFVQRGTIIQDRMILILLHEDADFAVIQSRIHEVWLRMVATTLGDALSYTTICFDTFPRPSGGDRQLLQLVGERYHDFRANLMKSKNEGLTKTYNRFHDPHERDAGILELRRLHSALDRAVLDAYGWRDLQPRLDFILNYDDEGDESGNNDRRKPWRYRWVDEDRDEILGRLLELNRTRSEEEAQSASVTPGPKRGRRPSKSVPVLSPNLFEVQEPTE